MRRPMNSCGEAMRLAVMDSRVEAIRLANLCGCPKKWQKNTPASAGIHTLFFFLCQSFRSVFPIPTIPVFHGFSALSMAVIFRADRLSTVPVCHGFLRLFHFFDRITSLRSSSHPLASSCPLASLSLTPSYSLVGSLASAPLRLDILFALRLGAPRSMSVRCFGARLS